MAKDKKKETENEKTDDKVVEGGESAVQWRPGKGPKSKKEADVLVPEDDGSDTFKDNSLDTWVPRHTNLNRPVLTEDTFKPPADFLSPEKQKEILQGIADGNFTNFNDEEELKEKSNKTILAIKNKIKEEAEKNENKPVIETPEVNLEQAQQPEAQVAVRKKVAEIEAAKIGEELAEKIKASNKEPKSAPPMPKNQHGLGR